jgi:hypothetical protein
MAPPPPVEIIDKKEFSRPQCQSRQQGNGLGIGEVMQEKRTCHNIERPGGQPFCGGKIERLSPDTLKRYRTCI